MTNNTIWEQIQNNPKMLELLDNKPSKSIKEICAWHIAYYELVCELDIFYNQ